jgi:hypothetical protein
VTLKLKKYIPHISKGLEVQDDGAGRLNDWKGLLSDS